MRYWLNEGKPLNDGRFCYVIDSEDGTQPVRTYGRTQQEVIDKLASQVEHSQKFVASIKKPVAFDVATETPEARPVSLPAPKQPMTPDERMRLTTDLGNPARAAEAAVRLVEDATGLDLREEGQKAKIRNFSNLCQSWENARPDFPRHPINRELVANKAVVLAGGNLINVTAQHLDLAFRQLHNSGTLVFGEDEQTPAASLPTPTPAVRPGESQAPRTVRPRGATSYSRTSLQATAPVATQRAKYTRAQIDAMTSKEYRLKLETEPGFGELVAQYKAQPRRASA